jgi:hypothetical protein
MDNKTLLIAGGIALLYFTMSKKKSGGQKFYVSPYGWVDESQLPSLGYTNVGGTWYSSGQINYAYGQAGVPSGTNVQYGSTDWYSIMNILNSLVGLTTTVISTITTVTQNNKAQAIDEILAKYTDPNSANFIPMFLYTRQDLEGMTVSQLQTILDRGYL